MTTQYDVKSTYTEVDAALVPYRARIKGAYIAVTTGGANPVIFYDNASAGTGTVLLKASCAVAGSHNVIIPGEGILAVNGIYCDTGSAAAVTLIYG
jgi:hypothetical protein